jgi:Spy/CpxP family protein refolding chaperone
MKNRTTLIAVLVAVAALAVAPLVMARPDRRGPNSPADLGILGLFGHVREELDLSDQQSDEIKAILADLHERNTQAREQLRGGRKSIADTLLDDPSNVAAAQKVLDEQSAAAAALKTNVLNATAKAIAVLTPEQREKLRTILNERAERRERRRR